MLKELGQSSVPLSDVVGRKQMEFLRKVGWRLVPTQDKQRPAHGAGHQRRCGFVDVHIVLKRNEGVAQDENDENENVHGCQCKGKNAFNVRFEKSRGRCSNKKIQRPFERLGCDLGLVRMGFLDLGKGLPDHGRRVGKDGRV